MNFAKTKHLCALALFVLTITSMHAERAQVAPGLWHEHRVTEGDAPLSIHFLEVDPEVNRLQLEVAQCKVTGLELTSSIAKRLGGIAAVNGGFFVRDRGVWDGSPQGACKVRDHFFSDSWWPFALGWSDTNGAQVTMGPVSMRARLYVGDKELPITRMNQYRRSKDVILYTHAFDKTTWTDDTGSEVIIKNNKISSIRRDAGNSNIPEGGFVYSVGNTSGIDIADLRPGMPAKVSYVFASRNRDAHWDMQDYILEGWPLLLSRGVIEDFSPERYAQGEALATNRDRIHGFINKKNPRTAVGILPNDHWLFVVVDGRQPDYSVGFSVPDLAQLMQGEGCRDALNLDGGGSSTCVLNDEVINSTSGDPRRPWEGTGERPVSDAIVIVPREK